MPHTLLFVHAHPDDETLTCGIAMGHHAARGDDVHVLTCTLGEEGEVIPPELAHLEGHPDDTLGPVRHEELARALAVIGATGHVLGADPARGLLSGYRDSGMAGSDAASRPGAFINADLHEAGAQVATLVRDLRPDVLVTYDREGGYRHPDHVQAHRLVRAALEQLSDHELPTRVLEILTPVSWAHEDRAWLRERDPAAYGLVLPADDKPFPPSVVDDARVTHVVDDGAALRVKNEALRAHATQVIVVSDDVHALSNRIARRSTPREGFGRVDPRTWAPWTAGSVAADLTT